MAPRPHPAQVNKPPQKFKKKTVFFLKTAPGKVDIENVKKLVRAAATSARPDAAGSHGCFAP